MRLMENEAQTAKFYKTFNIKSNMSQQVLDFDTQKF